MSSGTPEASQTESSAVLAEEAGLTYSTDQVPGIRRRRRGKAFTYVTADGRPVSAAVRARIKALVLPPAWKDVWIAPDARAHLQATGRDARGRKQYRYHADWSQATSAAKYGHLLAFGRALPAIRQRVLADRHRPALSREWVLATVVAILERTFIRIGNEEYARSNGSYGLTTLRDRHASVNGGHVVFRFRAKSGVEQRIDVADARLAKRVKQCQDLPGQTLFQYLDESGAPQAIGSSDVNAYLQEITGEHFTAKDFRTWAGTVRAACALADCEEATSDTAQARMIVKAIDAAAAMLGNTRSVCRSSYVHPAVLDAYRKGTTIATARPARRRRRAKTGLLDVEQAVLELLK